jgi:phospholipid N-methyltransferase
MSYLKRFAVTGSICPSTRVFGERAAREAAALSPGFEKVVVAGIGSGVVASRILARCPDAIFVECEAPFADAFKAKHPDAEVMTGRIEELFDRYPALRGQRILLASFVPTAGAFYSDDILKFFVTICRTGGLIMQMRYLPHQMSARFFDGMRARGIVSERLFTVARNLPPVSMFGMRSIIAPVSPASIIAAPAKQPRTTPQSIAARGAQG